MWLFVRHQLDKINSVWRLLMFSLMCLNRDAWGCMASPQSMRTAAVLGVKAASVLLALLEALARIARIILLGNLHAIPPDPQELDSQVKQWFSHARWKMIPSNLCHVIGLLFPRSSLKFMYLNLMRKTSNEEADVTAIFLLAVSNSFPLTQASYISVIKLIHVNWLFLCGCV